MQKNRKLPVDEYLDLAHTRLHGVFESFEIETFPSSGLQLSSENLINFVVVVRIKRWSRVSATSQPATLMRGPTRRLLVNATHARYCETWPSPSRRYQRDWQHACRTFVTTFASRISGVSGARDARHSSKPRGGAHPCGIWCFWSQKVKARTGRT